MTTHATMAAIAVLCGGGASGMVANLRACDWLTSEFDDYEGEFDETAARHLLSGTKDRPLPSCPICADFADAALTIRAEAEQEKVNAELDAEREAR